MKINHHPDDSTIMAYAAGTLTEGFSLVVAAHLENCEYCRSRITDAQELAGELLNKIEPADLPSGGIDDLWNRIESSTIEDENTAQMPVTGINDDTLPGILSSMLGSGLDMLPWRILAPGIRQHKLDPVDSEKGTVRLLSIAPGVAIPKHSHLGNELTLILKGSYQDEIGTFQSGDIADLDSSISHQPVAGESEDCICLIATDRPLRFSGIVSRVLQPFIGI